MKDFIRLLAIFLTAILGLSSCSDNNSVNGEPDRPDDDYVGPHCNFTLGPEAEGLSVSAVEVTFLSDSGEIFSRSATHTRSGDMSTFHLDTGLAEGGYRLIDVKYEMSPNAAILPQPGEAYDDDGKRIFGLGSHISVTADGIAVTDSFDRTVGMAGRGTKENPFIISSPTHFFRLMMAVNDYDINGYITEHTYFRQVCDIDMKSISRSCDVEYGWLPVGADTNTPFRGVFMGGGHTVKNLIIDRPSTASVGLFGNVDNALIDSLTIQGATITGQYGVGAVAGAVITAGNNDRGEGSFINCTVKDCTISTPSTGAAAGGVLGATDMHARALISNCSVAGGSLSGGMNIGGVTGGAGIYSSVMISGCSNETPVTASLSGAGGMVGTADTLQVIGCRNAAAIRGGALPEPGMPVIGTGGIVGGSGYSWITGCINSGKVTGLEGTGGIIGSTRVKGSDTEAFLYNQSLLRWCSNSADVTGTNFTGGAIGEAQAGTYGVVNTGRVSGADYVGGICGNSSVAVLHNSVNSGTVEGGHNVGGILGKCTWGSLAILQNGAAVTSKSGNAAGIVALAGNNTILNYCSNFGTISGPSSGKTGGIAGEMGDPRTWTGVAIAECVVGSLECVMALVGPCLAVAESAIAMAEGVEIALKITELSIEVTLQSADYLLVGYGISELISPEAEEGLEKMVRVRSEEANESVESLMSEVRSKLSGTMPSYLPGSLSTDYCAGIERLTEWYETGENDEIFNEAVNETREERAGELEKVAKANEIIHTVVAGVAVVASTVAAIGATVATGGAATAFMLAGATAAVVGGVNAIVKSCTEFEKNAVVISQCVNAAPVKSPGNGNCSSICGKICDGCVIRDCLSTAPVDSDRYDAFAGGHSNHNEIFNCIALQTITGYSYDSAYLYDNVFCDNSLSSGQYENYSNGCTVAADRMNDESVYTPYGFRFGTGESWIIPEGAGFPIPSKSQMQK